MGYGPGTGDYLNALAQDLEPLEEGIEWFAALAEDDQTGRYAVSDSRARWRLATRSDKRGYVFLGTGPPPQLCSSGCGVEPSPHKGIGRYARAWATTSSAESSRSGGQKIKSLT